MQGIRQNSDFFGPVIISSIPFFIQFVKGTANGLDSRGLASVLHAYPYKEITQHAIEPDNIQALHTA